mgnify:CR=1 FL=1
MSEFDEICAICHENMNIVCDYENIYENMYELPECKHYFHTNCILTWFRCGHKSCPLCMNCGINDGHSSVDLINTTLNNYHWQYRKKLLNDNYIEMRKFSKKKGAPIELKRKFIKIKKLEDKLKVFSTELKQFINSIQDTLTVKQVRQKGRRMRNKKWNLTRKINNLKSFIGLSNPIINIIIAKKVDV